MKQRESGKTSSGFPATLTNSVQMGNHVPGGRNRNLSRNQIFLKNCSARLLMLYEQEKKIEVVSTTQFKRHMENREMSLTVPSIPPSPK